MTPSPNRNKEAPAAVDLARVLASHDLLLRIDAALSHEHEGRRGWALADATKPGLPWARVHVRPWLEGPDGTSRLLVERESGPLQPDRLPAGYGLVLLANDPAEMEEAALQALRGALDKGRPALSLFGTPEGELSFARQGKLHPLPPARPFPPAETVRIAFRGREELDLETTLPAMVRIHGAEARDALLVRTEPSAGFGNTQESFVIETKDGAPLGEVLLRLGFRPDGETDRLVLSPEGSDGRVRIRNAGRQPAKPQSAFSRFPEVRLHLVFDCTTLDLEAWPRALAAVTALAEEEGTEEAFMDDHRSKRKWNLEIRRRLAAGLQTTVSQLHRKVTLDLWWFADEPRPDMAPPDGLPIAPAAWGHPGVRRLEALAEALLVGDFDYACGMDLFDAVDEALERVAERIGELGGEHHAVLIVGDSPPPPADEEDPLWRRIVDGSLRTSGRLSPAFRRALVKLSREGVPVGWLFVRHPRSPEAHQLLLDYYPRFQTLREETLAALQQQPGLLVEGCDGVEDLDRCLGVLFRRMRTAREAVSQLSIREV